MRIESTLRLYRMIFYLACFAAIVAMVGLLIGETRGAQKAFMRVSEDVSGLATEIKRYNAIRYADDMVYRQALQKLSQNDSILSANYHILNLRIAALEAQKKPQP